MSLLPNKKNYPNKKQVPCNVAKEYSLWREKKPRQQEARKKVDVLENLE
jgi:hypothetical protein